MYPTFTVPKLTLLWLLSLRLIPLAAETWEPLLTVSNGHVLARVAPQVGRIVHLGLAGGENLLREDKDMTGLIPPPDPRRDWSNYGGDWLWPVSQDQWRHLGVPRRWPPPPMVAHVPWSYEQVSATEILLWLDVGAPLHIRVSRRIFLNPDSPLELIIEQRILRTAPSDIPVCLWQVAQCANVHSVQMEVPESTRHPKGFHQIQGPEPAAEALRRSGTTLSLVVAASLGAKLGTDGARIAGQSPAGSLTIEVFNGDEPGGLPDGGCSLAVAVSQHGDYTELETMSAELNLPDGGELRNRLVYRLEAGRE